MGKNEKEKFIFLFPKIGEMVSGGTIIRWLKKNGDIIKANEPVLEVSTDKVATEVSSPVAGILNPCAKEGAFVNVGEILAYVYPGDGENQCLEEDLSNRENDNLCFKKEEEHSSNEFLSPAVLNLAQREGIGLEKLKELKGTGLGGRLTKHDLEKYIHMLKEKGKSNQLGEDRIPMSALRQAIAMSTSKSSYEVPHASLVVDVDVTDLMNLISKEKVRFLEIHGCKLTITSFIVHCLTQTLQHFPLLNGSLEANTIIMKRSINVGIAVNLNKEGVVIPVIKNCQERTLVSIAKALSDLALRARTGKLDSSDVREGTITVTNFGMAGGLIGIPIIHYPEVAILGIGSIKKGVVVREDDSLVVRQLMYITLTFDHRMLDGIYGSEFLTAFKGRLESVSIS